MKKFFTFILLSVMTFTCLAQTEAKDKAQLKKEKKENKIKKAKEEDIIEGKVPGHVYVCGCSFDLADSVIYITSINTVDSLTITKKTKFLPYRSDFSQQFKDKLESPAFGAKNQTASVIFSDKKEKLQKSLNKLKKYYLTKTHMQIVTIGEDKFKFVHPLDYFGGQ